MQEQNLSEERQVRRQGNNKALSDQIATSYLYKNIQQYFGLERGQAIIKWLQIGLGEAQIFDEKCKAWLLSEDLVNEMSESANQGEFSAFSTEHDKWVQITQTCYRELVQQL